MDIKEIKRNIQYVKGSMRNLQKSKYDGSYGNKTPRLQLERYNRLKAKLSLLECELQTKLSEKQIESRQRYKEINSNMHIKTHSRRYYNRLLDLKRLKDE